MQNASMVCKGKHLDANCRYRCELKLKNDTPWPALLAVLDLQRSTYGLSILLILACEAFC